jgi:hypothetical protein
MITDIIASGAMHSVKLIFQKKKERNIIIDPFSCLVKLSLIRYLDEGTKISINQNRLNFNPPGYIQGIIRFMYGDNREDLHNLLLPLQKCVEWYWNENNADILYMFNNAVLGLKFLKNSYSTFATIQHTLDYYIIIIMQKNNKIISKMGINTIDIEKLTNAVMEDINGIDNLQGQNIIATPKTSISTTQNIPTQNNTNNNEPKILNDIINDKEKDLRDIHKFLYELWNEREMNIVMNLYKELENKEQIQDRDYIYNNIMYYCEMKENKLYKYIEQNSSIL